MIKKLQRRFITASMLAFLLVITLIASLVNLAYYLVETQRIDNTLDSIVNYGPYQPQFAGPGPGMPAPGEKMPDMEPFRALPDIEANYMTRFFIVALDDDGDVLFTSMDFVASVDSDEAEEYAQKAAAKPFERGYIGNYRYALVEADGADIIVFLNCEKELQSMHSILWMTILISAAALVLVFILVLVFSKRAIQPITQNIEIQKRFITDASHELKTPLTSISTSVDVIEMDKGSDEWTENIRQQVGQMSGLVSQLISLSKLDEVKPVTEKEQFDLSSACWETLEVHIPQAKARGKEIETYIDDNVSVTGEKASIQQMLSVLIDNAIKYSDDNGAIRLSVSEEDNGKAKIEVFNTCDYAEIPDTERIFDRFYRIDESRNASTGGNGIGLAIAKAVVDAHGGKIKASCPSGKSMTITVEI